MDFTEELNSVGTGKEDLVPNSHLAFLMYRKAANLFWHEEFWLPLGYKWKDLEPSTENLFPNYWDLWTYPFIIAAGMLVIQVVTTNTIFIPFAQYLGINFIRNRSPVPNKVLEKVYQNKYTIPVHISHELAHQLGWKQKDIDRWIRQKRASKRLTTGEKFCHACFQFVYHSLYNVFGIVILWNKEWLWDITLCYKNYPNFIVTNDIWWYYMIALGVIVSNLLRRIVFERARKDSIIDLVHHSFAICLLVISWSINVIRAGTLVLLLHYWNDGFLLMVKMAEYAKKDTIATIFFCITLISWFITRMILFPFWVIHSTLYEGPKYGFMPAAYIFYGCLVGIGILNTIWFGMMLKILYKKLVTGVIEDIRSSEEDFSEKSQDKEE